MKKAAITVSLFCFVSSLVGTEPTLVVSSSGMSAYTQKSGDWIIENTPPDEVRQYANSVVIENKGWLFLKPGHQAFQAKESKAGHWPIQVTNDGVFFAGGYNSDTSVRIYRWNEQKDHFKSLPGYRFYFFQVTPAGDYLYINETNKRAAESHHFSEVRRESQQRLHFAAQNKRARRIQSEGYFIEPRIVNGGNSIYYWAPGTYEEKTKRKNWHLYSIDNKGESPEKLFTCPWIYSARRLPPATATWYGQDFIIIHDKSADWVFYDKNLEFKKTLKTIDSKPEHITASLINDGKFLLFLSEEGRITHLEAYNIEKNTIKRIASYRPGQKQKIITFKSSSLILFSRPGASQRNEMLIYNVASGKGKIFKYTSDQVLLPYKQGRGWTNDRHHRQIPRYLENHVIVNLGAKLAVVSLEDHKQLFEITRPVKIRGDLTHGKLLGALNSAE